MKTSQVSKDTSADERSKLGVCNSQPRHPRLSPSAPWGLWTGRIKSYWEQFGLIPPPLRCFSSNAWKGNLTDTTGSDWASVDFSLPFSLFFLAAQFKVKYIQKKINAKEKRCGVGWEWEWSGVEWEGWVRHYGKPICKTTPLFFYDKTSVAKGQGDLHGNASKEKDTRGKWKDMRSTPPSLPKRCIHFHKKDGVQFFSGENSPTIWSGGD